MTALTNIIERIENSIFHALRLETLDKEYIPDITLFPDTDQGVVDYKAAFTPIIAAKGFAIEVYGVSSNQKKGQLRVPRIVILEQQRLLGATGGDPSPYYEAISNLGSIVSYDRLVQPAQSKEFTYQIKLIYATAKQGRILHQLLALALPAHGYIEWYDDPTEIEKIFINQVGFSEMSYGDEGVREASYMYTVTDIWDTLPENTGSVAPINEITVEVNVQDPEQTTPDNTIIEAL